MSWIILFYPTKKRGITLLFQIKVKIESPLVSTPDTDFFQNNLIEALGVCQISSTFSYFVQLKATQSFIASLQKLPASDNNHILFHEWYITISLPVILCFLKMYDLRVEFNYWTSSTIQLFYCSTFQIISFTFLYGAQLRVRGIRWEYWIRVSDVGTQSWYFARVTYNWIVEVPFNNWIQGSNCIHIWVSHSVNENYMSTCPKNYEQFALFKKRLLSSKWSWYEFVSTRISFASD